MSSGDSVQRVRIPEMIWVAISTGGDHTVNWWSTLSPSKRSAQDRMVGVVSGSAET